MNTGKQIAGATVTLSSALSGSFGYYDARKEWEFITGEEGYYKHKFHADNKRMYFISAKKESECYSLQDPQEKLNLGKKNPRDMSGGATAEIQFHIKNVNPFNNNDTICIYGDRWPGFITCKTGQNVNSSAVSDVNLGKTKIQIRWDVTKNNILSSFSDSIFIVPCIINDFYINY